MNSLIRFLHLDQYTAATRKRRAMFVYGVMVLSLSAIALYAIFVPDFGPLNNGQQELTLIEYAGESTIGVFYLVWIFGVGMASLLLTRFGHLEWGAWGPPAIWLVLGGISTLAGPSDFSTPSSITALSLLIITAGVFKDELGTLLASVIAILLFLLDYPPDAPGVESTIIALIGVGGMTYLFADYAKAARSEGEVSSAQERIKLAEINTRVTRMAADRASLNEVLNAALDVILDNYPQIYHVQIFLIDDDGIQAELRASTGETGKKLIESDHSLAVGSMSVIGQTTLKGQPVIARAGGDKSVHRRNERLPETQVEAAFPLQIDEKIIGALDLQSRDDLTLTDDDISSFQSLADSISLAIDNVRQFEIAQTRVEQNQKLAEQARNALREVERLNQRLIGRAWSEYLGGQDERIGFNVDLDADTVEDDSRWTPTLANAAETNSIIQRDQIIAIPLRVRGRVIGAMEFELNTESEFSPEDLDLVQEISERFGLAAENTRLVEQSQRTAQREALINEITSRFQSARDVEATLAEAARSFNETFTADRVAIRMGIPDSPDKNADSSSNDGAND